MVDRIRYPTVSYLPFYYVFFQFLLLTIFNLQANILTTKDILSNLGLGLAWIEGATVCIKNYTIESTFLLWLHRMRVTAAFLGAQQGLPAPFR